MATRRASRRYPAKLDISVHGPGHSLVGRTLDISRYGLLIESQEIRRVGELVQLWVAVREGQWIQMLAVVARLLPDLPGFGVRLHMMGGAEKRLWDELLEGLGDDRSADSKDTSDNSEARAARPRFLIRPRSVGMLERLAERELSLGGMFVRTPIPRPVGTSIELLLIHPTTENAFEVTGEVVVEHRHGELHERGNGIVFWGTEASGETGLLSRFAAFCERERLTPVDAS